MRTATAALACGVFAASKVASSSISKFSTCAESSGESIAFSPKEFRSFKILKIQELSPNTKAFEVALPRKEDSTGVTCSSFVMVKNAPGGDGKFDARPYTPTSLNDRKGSFELVIKAYPGGKVTQHLFGLKVGDMIEVKGPLPKLKYVANMKKHIGMVAGGTGITPCLQVIQEILNNPADKTEISLVFANNDVEDILLKDRLDALAKKHSNFKVTYVLATPSSASWTGEVGFCTEALLKAKLPSPSPDSLVLVCGPPGMMKAVSGPKTEKFEQGLVDGILKALGFKEEMVFKF